MRRRTTLITAAAVTVAGLGTGLGLWLSQPSYDDTVKTCRKALVAQTKAGGTGKPSACKGVKQDDYDEIVVANVLGGMSKKDRDTLDYYDNGTIDGSIG